MLAGCGGGHLYGVRACTEEARGEERRVVFPDFPLERLPRLSGIWLVKHPVTWLRAKKFFFFLFSFLFSSSSRFCRRRHTGAASSLAKHLDLMHRCSAHYVWFWNAAVSKAEWDVQVVMCTRGCSTWKNCRCLAAWSSVFRGVDVDLQRVITRRVKVCFYAVGKMKCV